MRDINAQAVNFCFLDGYDSMANHGRSRRSMAFRSICFLLSLVLIAGIGYYVGEKLEESSVKEERSTMSSGFGRYEEKIYQGETYYKKTNVTTLLLMGVDRDITQTSSSVSYRNGGQADFLMLLVIDHDAGTIRQLQIERDTMAKVDVLTILGKPGGTRMMQICLSHGYGADQAACCENAVYSVSRYLDDLDIDLYMAVDYSAIDVVNSMLGGVTVTLKEDFSALDPAMTAGTTLKLQGHQAELFVRSRMSVGDGTNASRQLRQREWLDGATELLKAKVRDDSGFLQTLLEALGDGLTTNAAQGRLVNEFNQAWQYPISPVEQIPGTYATGSDGFVEYHTEKDDVTRWVLDTFYRPAAETGKESELG